MNVTREAIEELSAAALAKELHVHVRKVKALFEAGKVEGAYQTEPGPRGHRQWRVPRWCWARFQAIRGGINPTEVWG